MKGSTKRIVVVGTGYVGLPAAIMLAQAGHEVVGVDIDQNIVDALNRGEMHIDEAELAALMREDSVRRNLRGERHPTAGDVFIIAVPTPLDRRKKVADLTYVRDAVTSLLPCLRPGNLVIVESTVPPLTCREVVKPMIEGTGLRVPEDVLLAHGPERILPGNIFHEILHNDRVIGGVDVRSAEAAQEIYASFVQGDLFLTDDVTAEMCKLMENTYRDVNVALANEFAAVASTLGVNVNEAIRLANRHPRVDILQPGIGVGGHCIPLDPWFLKEVDPENCSLIFAARRINDAQPARVAAQIRQAVRDVPEPRLVALGKAYKANSGDVRESPAIEVVRLLVEDGYEVTHLDPLVDAGPYCSLREAARGADGLAILAPHDVIMAELARDEAGIRAAMRHPRILIF